MSRGSSQLSHLECARCGRSHDADVVQQRCECGGTLLARYDLSGMELSTVREREPGMWRYRELLPVGGEPVSLGEPETPFVFLRALSERWGVETWLKDDGALPSGTFKARGAAAGVSRALELGVKEIAMPTAGNAGGAWALYCARAGIELTVVMAHSAPEANRTEAEVAGATVELVDGSIADAGRRAKEIATERGAFFAGTFYEPYRLEGKKSAWLEVYDRAGDEAAMRLPRTLVIPVGGGVAAVAAAKAAVEAKELGWTTDDAPVLVGVQPEDCAPIVRAFEQGSDDVAPWEQPTMTIAAGLRVPAPAEGALVLDRVRSSGGTMLAVPDRDIRLALRTLAATEGVFACPEGAATVAAADRLARKGELEGPVVLYNTGSGIKYVDVL
ncbi:MAG TPA: threonine synthase [Actinomycetota bacterium]|nr:threonine synthase [Actinomycetota bacterium]